MALVAIVGSAFNKPVLSGISLNPRTISTPHGEAVLYQHSASCFVLPRHGCPHRYLPHQVPYLAHADALKSIGCKAVLILSSVGVLDDSLPLNVPMFVKDLVMLDNRLPDGRTCTIFQEPSENQGHLVWQQGPISENLIEQMEILLKQSVPRVRFAYVGGPRTKTYAENNLLRQWGIQVNSMTVGPEVVLANELEIPVVVVVIGHKYSLPQRTAPLGTKTLSDSLNDSRQSFETITRLFFEKITAPPFANTLYRFSHA